MQFGKLHCFKEYFNILLFQNAFINAEKVLKECKSSQYCVKVRKVKKKWKIALKCAKLHGSLQSCTKVLKATQKCAKLSKSTHSCTKVPKSMSKMRKCAKPSESI